MHNFKDDIAVPSHNDSESNVVVPKIRIIFGQQSSQYNFIRFSRDHDLSVHNFKTFFNE